MAQPNSSLFHFFCTGFLFKILGNVTNSLLLRSAIRDVNKICKSRSRAKSEKKVRSYFQHLRIITPFIIWYQQEPITPGTSYRKTLFQPHLTHFLTLGIFYFDRLNLDDFITYGQGKNQSFFTLRI